MVEKIEFGINSPHIANAPTELLGILIILAAISIINIEFRPMNFTSPETHKTSCQCHAGFRSLVPGPWCIWRISSGRTLVYFTYSLSAFVCNVCIQAETRHECARLCKLCALLLLLLLRSSTVACIQRVVRPADVQWKEADINEDLRAVPTHRLNVSCEIFFFVLRAGFFLRCIFVLPYLIHNVYLMFIPVHRRFLFLFHSIVVGGTVRLSASLHPVFFHSFGFSLLSLQRIPPSWIYFFFKLQIFYWFFAILIVAVRYTSSAWAIFGFNSICSHFVRPRDRLSYPVSFPVPVVCRHSFATFYSVIVSSFVAAAAVFFLFAFSNSTNIIALHSWLQIARLRCTVLLGKVGSACAYRSYVECGVYVWPSTSGSTTWKMQKSLKHTRCVRPHWMARYVVVVAVVVSMP